MNHDLIINLIREQLVPHIAHRKFRVLHVTEQIASAGQHYEPIFPYKMHSHSLFEWVWCIENCAFLKIGKENYRLDAGDFCLVLPGTMHVEMYHPAQQEYKILWCAFKDETIGAHLHAYTPVGHLKTITEVSAPAPPYTRTILGALQYESQAQLPHRHEINAALIKSLAHLMLRAFEMEQGRDQQSFIPGKVAIRVNRFLEEHFSEELSLTDVADKLYVSRNYLATLYKQETGTTIGKRLTEIRLEKAKRLLLETPLSVKQVAAKVGFASPEHFSRIFRQHEGVSPGRYGK